MHGVECQLPHMKTGHYNLMRKHAGDPAFMYPDHAGRYCTSIELQHIYAGKGRLVSWRERCISSRRSPAPAELLIRIPGILPLAGSPRSGRKRALQCPPPKKSLREDGRDQHPRIGRQTTGINRSRILQQIPPDETDLRITGNINTCPGSGIRQAAPPITRAGALPDTPETTSILDPAAPLGGDPSRPNSSAFPG